MKTTFDYLEKEGFESVTDYCRYLVENKVDFPPETKIEVYRGDMLCLTVNDIYDAAKLYPSGSDGGFRLYRGYKRGGQGLRALK